MNTLVVPTIRENCINEFLLKWRKEPFQEVIVVEDNPTKTFTIGNEQHYSWKEIHDILGDDDWIISKRDSAIRSFGFWMAWKRGATTIFTLDDDCWPVDWQNPKAHTLHKPVWGFINEHFVRIYDQSRWTELVPGMRTRGLPYRNQGRQKNIVANVGLWTNVPDLDGAQSLLHPVERWEPPANCDRIMPTGQYFPWTGMNFAFKRDVAVMCYFPLMGQDSPYGRFEDIWFGIIFKKIADHLGLLVSVGHPFVYHARASNPFNNLIKEAPGIKANEDFWELVDGIQLSGRTPAQCMSEVGDQLSGHTDVYWSKLGRAILVWVKLFE